MDILNLSVSLWIVCLLCMATAVCGWLMASVAIALCREMPDGGDLMTTYLMGREDEKRHLEGKVTRVKVKNLGRS